MYAFPSMLELADQKWKSEAHRKVAEALLIGNFRIETRSQLIEFGSAINGLTEDEVKTLTVEGAVMLGIPFN